MPLLSYGVFTLGVVLGGLVLLVLFSLPAMAQKGDESLGQLELEMLQIQEYAALSLEGENQKTSMCRPPPIFITAAPPKF